MMMVIINSSACKLGAAKMMITKETFAKHRERIVAAAARLFRARGLDAVRVTDVMKSVGLTHGGFYNHFASKEALASVACEAACSDGGTRFVTAEPGTSVRDFVTAYLSKAHLRNAGDGCVFAALGSEAARTERPIRKVLTDGMTARFDRVGRLFSGTPNQRRAKAIATLAGLIGALTLARIATDDALADEILATAAAALGDVR
jgi:TetR/AcrR family transcriptional repressor of nem operon